VALTGAFRVNMQSLIF